MQALVRFITTGKTELDSWNCPVGRAYLAATCDDNPVLALAMGLYEDAAYGDFNNVNSVWNCLQNFQVGWRELNAGSIECLTQTSRSIMVGDIVVFEDGRCFICARYGWKDLSEMTWERIAP